MTSRIPVSISFNGITNFLGVIGVIGSLIFVGLELRQTQKIALGNQIQQRANMQADFLLANLQGTDIGRKLLATQRTGQPLNAMDPSILNEDEFEVFNLIHQWRVNSVQNVFQQYQLGLLSDGVWSQVAGRINAQYSNCALRSYFNGVIPAFQDYLSNLPDNCPE